MLRKKGAGKPRKQRPTKETANQVKQRVCLGCKKKFLSGGPGHRFCSACSETRRRELRGYSIPQL